jgi:hypothetical protein
MPSPYSIAASGLTQIITTEFADLSVVPRHDELHESLGEDGRYVGISIDERGDAPMVRNRAAQETWCKIQWFEKWIKDVDPYQVVDPRTIAGIAHRLQTAIAAAELTYTGDFWFFNWEGTTYPRDPVGNKTRFIMLVRAYSNNAGLVETGG